MSLYFNQDIETVKKRKLKQTENTQCNLSELIGSYVGIMLVKATVSMFLTDSPPGKRHFGLVRYSN